MRKFFLLFIAILASSFIFAQSGQKKEKKVTWHFEVSYPISIGSDQIRSNWDLGYVSLDNGIDAIGPLNPLCENWFSDKDLIDYGFQKKSCPLDNFGLSADASFFIFNKDIPMEEYDSFMKQGDRKSYGGFSKTSTKILFPHLQLGMDYKFKKNLYLSLDLFGRGNQINTLEEGYVFFVKDAIVWAFWDSYKNIRNKLEIDAIVEHSTVNMEMNIYTIGLNPMIKYEISIAKGISILPKVGFIAGINKINSTSNWKINYLFPYDYFNNLYMKDSKIEYFDESNYTIKNSQTKYAIYPTIGVEFENGKIFLDAQIEFGNFGNINVVSKSDEPYKGLLLYESNNKIQFPDISAEAKEYQVENYGQPKNRDFINLKKINKIVTIGVGIRF